MSDNKEIARMKRAAEAIRAKFGDEAGDALQAVVIGGESIDVLTSHTIDEIDQVSSSHLTSPEAIERYNHSVDLFNKLKRDGTLYDILETKEGQEFLEANDQFLKRATPIFMERIGEYAEKNQEKYAEMKRDPFFRETQATLQKHQKGLNDYPEEDLYSKKRKAEIIQDFLDQDNFIGALLATLFMPEDSAATRDQTVKQRIQETEQEIKAPSQDPNFEVKAVLAQNSDIVESVKAWKSEDYQPSGTMSPNKQNNQSPGLA